MRSKVVWREEAEKNLEEIGRSDWLTAEKIREKVEKHLASHPTQNGKPLSGKWQGFWRYRCLDIYRIIYEVKQNELLILVVKVGHRSKVYKKV